MSRLLSALVVSMIALTPSVRPPDPNCDGDEEHNIGCPARKVQLSPIRTLRIAHVNRKSYPRLWRS